MKRSISKILMLTMLFAFSVAVIGCGGSNGEKEKFIGTWEAEVNLAEQVNEGIGADETLAENINVSEFILVLNFTFNEDGTYEITLDEDRFYEAREGIRDDFREGIGGFFQDMIDAEGMDVSVDELCAAGGFTLDDVVDDMVSGFNLEMFEASVAASGKYEVRDGKLYTSDSKDTDIDESVYETYEFDGEDLKLTELVGAETDEFTAALYPLALKRVQ